MGGERGRENWGKSEGYLQKKSLWGPKKPKGTFPALEGGGTPEGLNTMGTKANIFPQKDGKIF